MRQTSRYGAQADLRPSIHPAHLITRSVVDAALAGNRAAADALLALATPVVRARARRALRRTKGGQHALEGDVDDLAQEVLAALLSDDARALRGWDPERGLSLRSFVALVAQRRISSLLRRSTHVCAPTAQERDAIAESRSPHPSPEASLASRQLVSVLCRSLQHALSPHALDLFERLYLRDESVDEVAIATGLSLPSVYQWRRRLLLAARKALSVADQTYSDTSSARQIAAAGGE